MAADPTPPRLHDLAESVNRLEMMLEDTGETWDLSENDRLAIQSVLAELTAARLAQQEADKQFAKWVALADEQEQRAIAAEVAQQEAERQFEIADRHCAEAVAAAVKYEQGLTDAEARAEAAESRLTEARQENERLRERLQLAEKLMG